MFDPLDFAWTLASSSNDCPKTKGIHGSGDDLSELTGLSQIDTIQFFRL